MAGRGSRPKTCVLPEDAAVSAQLGRAGVFKDKANSHSGSATESRKPYGLKKAKDDNRRLRRNSLWHLARGLLVAEPIIESVNGLSTNATRTTKARRFMFLLI
jgi:hypothetical protein